MKNIFAFVMLLCAHITFAQGDNIADSKFHQGSSLFINGNTEGALAAVNEGLKTNPGHIKLNTLKKILEEQKKEEQQQKKEQEQKEKKEKQKQEQQNKDQQNKEKEKEDQKKQEKEQQNKDQQNKEQQEKDQKEQKDKQEKGEQDKKEPKDKEQKENKDQENKEVPPEVLEKLKDMKISEEKARMILEAMKNQEIQYLQQNKRQASKPKDRGKPDW